MSSLAIQCALLCDNVIKQEPDRPLVLYRVGSHEETGSWVANGATCLRMAHRSSVFRATLHSGEVDIDVVLKIDTSGDREDAFLREGGVYDSGAKELQGDVVPMFYGCFSAEINRKYITCLVLQYRGEPMSEPLEVADLELW